MMDIVLFLVISSVVAFIVIFFLIIRPRYKNPPFQKSLQDREYEELLQNLRQKCMFDELKISRLINYERGRNPNASEKELIRAAIYRWERDNS